MTKKTLNQNAKYVQELINAVEPNFDFFNEPISRFKDIKENKDKSIFNKSEKLLKSFKLLLLENNAV